MSDNYSSTLLTLVPGLAQGITRVCISYPFDYVRVFLQKNKYPNAKDFLKHNFRNVRGLYRGIKYPLSIIPLDRAITFKLYEDLNQKYNPLLSSFAVSSVTCIYNVPLQSINTNYILKNQSQKYFQFIKSLANEYKSSFVFKSYSVEYSRLVLGSTLYMGIYGNLRNHTPDEKKYHMMNGIITSMSTWSLLYPLDTIRVEHQTNNKGLLDTVLDKYKTQGPRSFYKGIGLVYIRTIPSASIGMVVYETVRRIINNHQ